MFGSSRVLLSLSMHVEIPHNFSQKEAVARVKKALNESKGQVLQHAPDFTERWDGDTLAFEATVQGKHITGTLEVQEKEFILDAKLPLLWRMFEGQIERAIKDQVSKLH